MKLPLADLRTPVAILPTMLLPMQGGGPAPGWTLQLHRAVASFAAGSFAATASLPPSPSLRRQESTNELESCGAPAHPGAPPALHAQPPAVPGAATEEPPPSTQRHEREPERAAVRLHVQAAAADGVKVWLGIDGDASLVAQRASAAVADLRRSLLPTGERIVSLVCNGVPVQPRLSSLSQPLSSKDSP